MTTSIIINLTKGNEKKQRSISNIDPNATANNLIEFSQLYTALSTYSYFSTVRVDKTELQWTEAANNG